MRPDDIYEFTRRRPFCPFRLYTTDGRVMRFVIPIKSSCFAPAW